MKKQNKLTDSILLLVEAIGMLITELRKHRVNKIEDLLAPVEKKWLDNEKS